MLASRHASEFDTRGPSGASNDCSRSTVAPPLTNVTPPSRRRPPEPATMSVRSKFPSSKAPSQTASQNHSSVVSTFGP
jgi:hypothetical protein